MGFVGLGRVLQDFWEEEVYTVRGIHFMVYTGGSPEVYKGSKYMLLWGYGKYGKTERVPTNDWKKEVIGILNTHSQVGNKDKYPPHEEKFEMK